MGLARLGMKEMEWMPLPQVRSRASTAYPRQSQEHIPVCALKARALGVGESWAVGAKTDG